MKPKIEMRCVRTRNLKCIFIFVYEVVYEMQKEREEEEEGKKQKQRKSLFKYYTSTIFC